ncbi:C4-dicarboxylate TRAP transporter substrate-binding protein [uncultured Roseibium sp.]|uniref:C4-dicarboxylate TRAP transporter substrate-binding protein n=1 Tax=uncultured Roseibium sp. TaxID=1936171 RepID=UPI0032171A83
MKTFARTAASILALAVGTGPALAGKTLSYASHVPSTHILHTEGMAPFYKQVETDTNGEITFKEFPGGAMGDAKSLLAIVRDGIVDSSLIVNVYYKADLPASYMITDLGMLGGDSMVMAAAAAETFLLDCPQCAEESARNHIKPLAYYASAPYILMCTKPVSTLEELQGLKVRAIGPWAIWLKDIGAVPVSVPSSEVYEALQRGQADCTIGSAAWLKNYNLKDVITYVTDLKVGTYFGALAFDMNTDTWNGLSTDERKAIVKSLPGITRRMVMAYREEDDAALKEGLDHGVKLAEPGQALIASYDEQKGKEVARVLGDPRAEKLELKGVVDALMKNVDKWTKILDEIGHDPDKYEEKLQEEIYSKISVADD